MTHTISPSTPPDWTLLDRYVADECTHAERMAVAAWLAGSAEARALFAGVQDGAREALPPRLLQATPAPTVPSARHSTPAGGRHAPWIGLGATVAVVLGGGLYMKTQQITESNDQQTHVVTSASQQRARVQLPDGSSVLLAPESKLQYDQAFGRKHRTLRLEGAALFTVAHADDLPFTVQAGHGEARVLGTSFTVRKYATDSIVQVVVASGRVGMGSSVLSSGDAVAVHADGRQQLSHAVNVSAALAWTHGRLEFRSAPLRDVIPELSRWYGIAIDVRDPGLLSKTITLSLTTETPSDVVALLEVLLDASAERHGTAVRFSPR